MTLLLQQQSGTRGWEFASTWFPLQPSSNSKEPNSLASKSESSLLAQAKLKVPGDAKSANFLFGTRADTSLRWKDIALRCVDLHGNFHQHSSLRHVFTGYRSSGLASNDTARCIPMNTRPELQAGGSRISIDVAGCRINDSSTSADVPTDKNGHFDYIFLLGCWALGKSIAPTESMLNEVHSRPQWASEAS